jgi:hypothetical protein
MEWDARIDVNSQYAHTIINSVMQARESLARDIASTKTRARILVWVGFLMVAGGATAFAIPLLRAMGSMNSSTNYNFFAAGPSIGGYPVGLVGFGVGFVGQFVFIGGIILHIVAASRRKQLLQLPDPRLLYGVRR